MNDNTAPAIITTVDRGVMTIQLNRPQKKNAVSLAMWRELRALVLAADGDPDVRVVILTGSGGSFSAGADILEFAELRSTPKQVAIYEEAVDGAAGAIASLSKPTIAAISGFCFAGGVALAASTDFRIADPSASFSVAAVRMGLVYNIAKCARLYQIVGLVAAKRILMTGQKFGAAEALRIGFVDELTDSDVREAAQTLADTLMDSAPLAVDGIKSILEALATGNVDAARPDLEQRIFRADASEDHREAVRAFAEKRRPWFRGR